VSVDVDALVAKITEEVTKQVLAAMGTLPGGDEVWPEWDEYNTEIDVAVVNNVVPVVPVAPVVSESVLRSRLRGVTEQIVDDDDDDSKVIEPGTNTGNVMPLSSPNSFEMQRGGFDPRSTPGWFDVQYQRDVVLPSRVAPR
jgi:hypothetical protein